MNFEELEKKVIEWAEDRAIFTQSDPFKQYDKLNEEFNELFNGLADEEPLCIKDSIGDMIVVLTMIAKFNNFTLTECYEFAYNEIKDRKGKMVDGIFVKEQ